jgi:hypothetical protein
MHKHAGVLRDDDKVIDIDGAENKSAWLASCGCDSCCEPTIEYCRLNGLPDKVTNAYAHTVLDNLICANG